MNILTKAASLLVLLGAAVAIASPAAVAVNDDWRALLAQRDQGANFAGVTLTAEQKFWLGCGLDCSRREAQGLTLNSSEKAHVLSSFQNLSQAERNLMGLN